jgi:broad specificity phosphatase PhoE
MRAASPPGCGYTEVLLLRHAATSWNDHIRRQGWADQPLTPAGRRPAAKWAKFAPTEFSVVCSSDLERARDTAQIIAAALGLAVVHELSALREQDQGEWTGMTKDEIKLRWPERMRERPRRPVGGEPPEAVISRVQLALKRLAAAHPGRRVLAVTHSEVIRTLERALPVPTPPVPHLEGRWLRVQAHSASQLEPSVEGLGPAELSAGRVGVAAGVKRLRAGSR